jgi:hypothetical protein
VDTETCTNYLTDLDQFDTALACRFYLSLDPRVRPVSLFLKHWADCHKLTGPSNITNYALTWLVIFYLQEASGFGLPSVELLQRLHEGPVKRIAGGEECVTGYDSGLWLLLKIILPVVLYGCETWSLTLREKQTGCLRTGC